jgi:hypothetical protein
MKRLAAISAVVLALGIGSAVAQPPPPNAPPPLRYEQVPPPPGERFIWEPGHWHWNGVQYVWVNGHYVERRAHYGHYVPGHWAWRPGLGRYVWIGAHWE